MPNNYGFARIPGFQTMQGLLGAGAQTPTAGGLQLTIPGGQVLTGQAAADYFAAHPAGTSPVLPQITTPTPTPAITPSQSSNLPMIPPGVSMTGGNVNQTTSSNRTMDLWDLIQSMQTPTPVQPGLSPPATGWGF